ncbi:hypothetical protein PybrP1_005543 [[Pythium] brassicae (nom. inval.)]|nr:hypothetical protein PybrP1_005543 [[Pythium] brassicae (nom. inval.)]
MPVRRLARVVVLSNGAAGAEKQALALSARLRLRLSPEPCDAVRCVRVAPTRFAQALPPLAHVAAAAAVGDPLFGYALSASEQRLLLHGDHNDDSTANTHRKPLSVVVGCGRTTVALGVALKRAARADVFAVQIQHPRVPLACFDAVVAPLHDFSLREQAAPPPGLFLTTGTVHDVSEELLARAAAQWRSRLGDLAAARRVCVAWLVGGPCRGFAFTPDDASAMVRQFVRVLLSTTAAADGCDAPAVFVTFSRRTPAKVVEIIERELRAAFSGDHQLFVWGGDGENPYHAFLALATLVVTTPDSISMTTEAVASARPVLTISAERAQGKFRRFHESLFASAFSAPFTAANVALALQAPGRSPPGRVLPAPHEALEREVSAIVDSLAQRIERLL